MTVMIGNARISERGTVNGVRGDQTGREVCQQPWTSGGVWSYVIRPKNADTARKIAAAMIAACNNNNIGYGQAGYPSENRLSLYNAAAQNGFKIDKVGKCNCDCSSLVAVCCWAAGIHVSPSMYTGNELAVLKATGKFEIITAAAYTKAPNLLRTGDILLRKGHTAIVTVGAEPQSAEKKPAKKTAKKTAPYQVGKVYTVTAGALNVRTGAGVKYRKKSKAELTADGRKHATPDGALKHGTKVTCKAVKNVAGNVWLEIPSGWIAARYKNNIYVE